MHTCGQTEGWTIDHVQAEKVSVGLQLEGPAGQAKVSVFRDGRDGVGGSRDRGTEDSGGRAGSSDGSSPWKPERR